MRRLLSIVVASIFIISSSTTLFIKAAHARRGCQGCCSYHGGITYNCLYGRVVCADNTVSPTCECSCLQYTGSTSYYDSGGGGGGDGGAAVAGALIGAGLAALIAAGIASNDPYKVNYGRCLEKVQKIVKEGKDNKVMDGLRTGLYHKRLHSCSGMPETLTLIPAYEGKQYIVAQLEDKIKKSKKRKEKKELKEILDEWKEMNVSNCTYFASGSNNETYVMKVYSNGYLYIPDQSGKHAVCSGYFPSKQKNKILKLYCDTQAGQYCHAKYLHESGTAEGRKKEFEQKHRK